MNKHSVAIRKYQPKDRGAVRQIACETAFGGHPERFVRQEEIVKDVLTLYFTDHEPQSCFVAEKDHTVVGYAFGARDVRRMRRVMMSKIYPRLLMNGDVWRFLADAQSRRLVWNAMKSFVRGEFRRIPVSFKQYPAVMHINVRKGFRRGGIGAELLQRYSQELRSAGIQGVHLGTLSRRAVHFFKKEGFEVVGHRRRSHLAYGLGHPDQYYVMSKSFNAPSRNLNSASDL